MKKILTPIKEQQFRDLCARLLKLTARRRKGSGAKIRKLILKIKTLFADLSERYTRTQLLRVPGAALVAAAMTFTPAAQAQEVMFAPPVEDAFGITVSDGDYLILAAADLDDDGDFDLLGSSYGGFRYFENIGTSSVPEFAAPVNAPFGITPIEDYLLLHKLADLDGDGDFDVFAGGYDGNLIYYENVGTASAPQFAAPDIAAFGVSAASDYYLYPAFADIDGDGDLDLFTGNYSSIGFYENTGDAQNPVFGSEQTNPFGLSADDEEYIFISFADIDGDGDQDIFATTYYENLVYYENIGTAQAPQFAERIDAPFGIMPTNDDSFVFPTFADFDDDGDMDMLTSEYYDYFTFYYYENITEPSSVSNLPEDFKFAANPNPTTDLLIVSSNYDLARLEIINTLGQTVLQQDGANTRLSLADLSSGLYRLRAVLPDGSFTVQSIMKQ